MNQSAKSYLERVQVLANRIRNQRQNRAAGVEDGLPIEELRMDLYAAIDRVLARHQSAVTIEQVRPELHVAVDGALGSVEPVVVSADRKLAQVVQSVFSGANTRGTAGSAAGTAPRLIRQVTPILLQFANDDKRLAQLENQLVKLLSARMGPQPAARIASAAVTAVRAMARNAGKK